MQKMISRLVGRDAQLARLEDVAERLRLRGPVVGQMQIREIVGEPGMGKTRLLTELSTLIHAQRQLILGGQATECTAERSHRSGCVAHGAHGAPDFEKRCRRESAEPSRRNEQRGRRERTAER